MEGAPVEILDILHRHFTIEGIFFNQDCEAIWLERDNAVRNWCGAHRVEVVETIGQTLWDPLEIIETNGGSPPLTYSQFCHVTRAVGPPRRPLPDTDLTGVEWVELESHPTLLSGEAL